MRSKVEAARRGPVPELRRVDRQHDLGGGAGERQLDLGVEQRRLARSELGVERRRAHEQPPQHHVAGGPRGQRADEAPGRLVELAAGQQRRHAGVTLQRPERVEPVRQHREVAHGGEPRRQPLQRRRGVDTDRPADADELDQLVGDPCLWPARAVRQRAANCCGPTATAPPRTRWATPSSTSTSRSRRIVISLTSSSPASSDDAHPPVDVEAPTDQLETVHALEVHVRHPASARPPLLGRAQRRSVPRRRRRTHRGRAPGRARCRSPSPRPGRRVTVPSTCSPSSRSSSADRAPPPKTCTLGSAELGDDRRRRLRHRLDGAADDLRSRRVRARARPRRRARPACPTGRGSARRWRRPPGPVRRRRRRASRASRSGSPHGSRHSSTSHQPGDVAQEADAADRALLVGEAGRSRRLGRVRLGRARGRRAATCPPTRTQRRRSAPPSTADAVSWPPTRCTGTPRQLPTCVPGSRIAGSSDGRRSMASSSSRRPVAGGEVEQPGRAGARQLGGDLAGEVVDEQLGEHHDVARRAPSCVAIVGGELEDRVDRQQLQSGRSRRAGARRCGRRPSR